ncbi:MAG: diacylglycerol kinase family lipid kinase [Acidimicrobiaceae bacterium]|nr:diacylglycerol kinase family lipid kinase [Acidimicrobiaceae bacterium]
MLKIAIIAHKKKTLGGGLRELRQVLKDRGYTNPPWSEVERSRQIPALARKAVKSGADVVFIWGGDGSVQRCVDAISGKEVSLAILPAGTANLLATNLKIPVDLVSAVDIGLEGERRRLDVGVLNGERFAVMAGVGFDALMLRYADDNLKEHFGRLAYVVSSTHATRMSSREIRITVDKRAWFKGQATCVLLGQMSSLSGGVRVFPNSRPDDGLLEIGVVTAENPMQWARLLARLAVGHAERSPLAQMTQGQRIDITLSRPTVYELDGSDRKATTHLRATIERRSLVVCVPREEVP